MKIIYICDNVVQQGGIERVVLTKANYFSDILNYKVIIIVTNNKKECSFYNISKNIEVINLNIDLNSLINILKYMINLKKILKEINPNIVMIPTAKEGLIYPFLNSKIYSVREIHFSKKSRQIQNRTANILTRKLNNFYDFIESKIIQRYNKLVVLTEEDSKQWKHKNIQVINNPKTIVSTECAKLKNKRAIALGRLDYQKGFDRLIKSWALIGKKLDGWVLEIYGEGPLKKELERLIIEMNLEKKVFLMGVTKNTKKCLLNSSIYVLSSRHEGLPLVLLEALECGLPIVSFDCPCGPKEIVKNGYNGFLIKDNNIVEMAKNIEKLMNNYELRILLGKNSKKESKKYSIEKIMNEWQELTCYAY